MSSVVNSRVVATANDREVINNNSNSVTKGKWRYKEMSCLGEGAFGRVFKSFDSSGRIVAVKKVLYDNRYVNREKQCLEMLDSPFCLKLLDYFEDEDEDNGCKVFNFVTDYCPASLAKEIRDSNTFMRPFSNMTIKLYAYQLFSGLLYLHNMGMAHRDIKPDNVIVDRYTMTLKICDFGSAKVIKSTKTSSPSVGSLHYRAPELLLGSKTYGVESDIWSAGCTIAAMLLHNYALFQGGKTDDDQLIEIFKVLGRPTKEDLKSINVSSAFIPNTERIASLAVVLPSSIDPQLLSLFERIFVYNPKQRITAQQVLQSPYFDELFQENADIPSGFPRELLIRPE